MEDRDLDSDLDRFKFEQARQGRVEAPPGRWVTSWGRDVIAAYAMVAGLVAVIAVLSAVDARRDDRLPVAEAVTVIALVVVFVLMVTVYRRRR